MAGAMRSTGQPAAAVNPQDGAVGQDLARMGVSKQNRLDQSFVDKTLGAGKYKAGSAEANMALQAAMKKQGAAPATAAAKPAAAPATAAAKPAAAPATAAAKLPAPQVGAAGQAARAASGKAPTPVAARQSTAAVMESREINRMRFLAGLIKD